MANRILYNAVAMISDLHVGDPNNPRLEDFDRDEAFEQLLASDLPKRAMGRPATLVIAGDFIDFPQIFPEFGRACPFERFGTTEDEAVLRVRRAIAGHPRVFSAMKHFLGRGNQILVLPGNHDIDLHFPRVFATIAEACGCASGPALSFVPEGTIQERGVYLEHGNQYSYDNSFEHWGNPIGVAPDGSVRVERPWGTLFMDMVYNDIEMAYPFVNKVYPHAELARIVLRLLRDDTRVATNVLARLVAFFVSNGKRALGGWALGSEDLETEAVDVPAIQSFVDSFADGLSDQRRQALVLETIALTGARPDAPGPKREFEEDRHGLLGRTDERGLDGRARALLRSGNVSIVGFGHTHAPFAKTIQLPGRTGFIFNTGSWIPRIDVSSESVKSIEAIQKLSQKHELKYLWLETDGNAIRPSLEAIC